MRILLVFLMVAGVMSLGCVGLDKAAEQWAESMQPVPPPEHLSEIVGVWQNDTVYLRIYADGMMEHERQTGASSASFNAPVLEWSDTSFTAGVGPISQTFLINAPPTAVDGVWTMTVNDNVLTRQ